MDIKQEVPLKKFQIDKDIFIVEKILKKKRFPGGITKYLVKWVGYSNKELTWEPQEHFQQSFHLVKQFEWRLKAKKNGWKLPPRNKSAFNKKLAKIKLAFKKNLSKRHHNPPVNGTKEVSQDTNNNLREKLQKHCANLKKGVDSEHEQLKTESIPPPEKILGVTHSSSGELLFVVKWNVNSATIVTAKNAKAKWPQVVIRFYEENYIRRFCFLNNDKFGDIDCSADHETRLKFLRKKMLEIKKL